MNKVVLSGRLTKDVDFRQSNDSAVARFTVACDRRYKREGDEQTADFITCVAFGKTAEFMHNYFSKGMKINLVGRIQTGSYTNKEGVKVYTTDVVAEDVEFGESKNASQQTGQQQTAPPIGQQMPQMQNAPQGYGAPPVQQQYQQNIPQMPQQQMPQQTAPQPQPTQNNDWLYNTGNPFDNTFK